MSTYEVVQMHDSVDATKLQFPKVPLEAIIQDPDHRSAPFGIPARVMELLSMSSTAPTPTAANQHYFNTATRKIHTSSASGQSFAWDASGSEPQAGVLYKVVNSGSSSEGDTLYVKSIDAQGAGLEPLVIPAADSQTMYNGPFAVSYTPYEDNICVVRIGAGKVITSTNAYNYTADSTGTVVHNGNSLWLTVNPSAGSVIFAKYDMAAHPGTQSPVCVRIAYNDNGRMVQCQYGDIYTSALT